jgi:hypothetical protein
MRHPQQLSAKADQALSEAHIQIRSKYAAQLAKTLEEEERQRRTAAEKVR